LGHPSYFQQLPHLGSVTARHVVVGVSQTLRRSIEGATYVRQGDHHVGHWPTFLVDNLLSTSIKITGSIEKRRISSSAMGMSCVSVCLERWCIVSIE